MKVKLVGVVVGVVVLALASTAIAVPYASGVTQVGDDVSFILNQNAWSVQAVLDGGAQTLNLPTTAGLVNFNMAGYSSYQIVIRSYESSGWSQYVADQTSTSFYVPLGVSINRDPLSGVNFGKVYISEAVGGTTAYGRTTTEGIWMLRADGWGVGKGAAAGVTWGGSSGPWKSTVGPDGHLYVTDLSQDLLFELDANASAGTQLIDASNRTANQWVHSVVVTGTQAGGDRKIYLVNGNYNDAARKGLIGYDLGGNPTAAPGDTGTQIIGPSYYTFYPYDFVRDNSGDWYGTQYRYDPAQAPAISKFDGDLPLPINTALWETPLVSPYNGGYCLDINEASGLVAYGNYYDGWVHIFRMADGSYVDGFDAGSRMRDIAFDAAGNVVTVDNLAEWARFWSPGGAWETVLGSDGTFSVTLVPEPTTLSLLALGGVALLLRRRR